MYENVNTLKRIIEEQVGRAYLRKALKKRLEGVTEFLKYSYITHLSELDEDPYHDIKFGIKHGYLVRSNDGLLAKNATGSSIIHKS